MTEPREGDLGVARGQLVGWAGVALVNAATMAVLVATPPRTATGVRVLSQLYHAGYALGAGLVACGVAALWTRFGPRRAHWGYVALSAGAFAIAAPVLTPDLEGLAAKLTEDDRRRAIYLWAIVLSCAAALPAAAYLGRRLARTKLWSLGSLLGVGAAAANHVILPNGYSGIHLYVGWGAATLLGVSVSCLALPAVARTRRSALVLVPLVLLTAWSFAVRPSNPVALQLSRAPGSPLASFVALARSELADQRASGGAFDDSHLPDVPPTTPALLPPNGIVIVIVVDALRADVVADGKYAAKLPEIERLRRESIEFAQARSPTTGTIWTLSTLFSSRYYSQLYWTVKKGGVSPKAYPHEDDSIRFPEVLERAGVPTVIVSEMPDVSNEYGVARGFAEQKVLKTKRSPVASVVMTGVLERLGRAGAGPMFMYVHFLEPHSPYDRGGKKGTDFERYLAEVAVVDRELARLREALATPELAERTALVFTADHGEAFGEHNTRYHGVSVYEELVRVPLLFRVPGLAPRSSPSPVSLIDLGPTVLDLMGHPTPGRFMGQTLTPLLRGREWPLTRPLVFDTGRWQRAMIFNDGFKVIDDRRKGTFELYDLNADPGELTDLSEQPESHADARLQALQEFFRKHALQRPGYAVPYRP